MILTMAEHRASSRRVLQHVLCLSSAVGTSHHVNSFDNLSGQYFQELEMFVFVSEMKPHILMPMRLGTYARCPCSGGSLDLCQR